MKMDHYDDNTPAPVGQTEALGRHMLYVGDCRDLIRALPDNSVDAVVTDPPYGLEFMGKEWDAPWKAGAKAKSATTVEAAEVGGFQDGAGGNAFSRSRVRTDTLRHGGDTLAANHGFQTWCETWLTECLRVLKPGGHLVAFGGTRTYHRLACAAEDAGFEIRDGLHWLYGSGFPKSLNVGKALGPPWEGWGTALKPAFEPIVLARKPLVGTVAANVLRYGTGAINVDGCRVEFQSDDDKASAIPQGRATAKSGALAGGVQHDGERSDFVVEQSALGRWPPNVLLDGEAAAILDATVGQLTSGVPGTRRKDHQTTSMAGTLGTTGMPETGYGDTGGPSRFYPQFAFDDAEADTLRFCYSAKTSKAERGEGNKHPTVKPLALMRWLARLVTPPGGTILEPFGGSGTTILAGEREGFTVIAAEKSPEYAAMIRLRWTGRAAVFASQDKQAKKPKGA